MKKKQFKMHMCSLWESCSSKACFLCFKCLRSHPNTKDMDPINEGRTTHYFYTPFIGDDG